MALAVRPIEDKRLLGIGLVLIAYAMFTVIDSCAKWLTQAGMPLTQVVFVRYAAQLLLVSAIFLPSRGTTLFVTRSPWVEILRGLSLMASTITNFIAIQFLPLTVTSSIMFTMPLMITALSIPMLGETVGWRRWVAIVIGFLGILVIVQPGSDAFHPAVLWSLAAAFFGALYALLTRRLAGVDTVTTQQFYAALVATVCIAPLAASGDWALPVDGPGWFAFLMIGTAGLVGHQILTAAHRLAPASVLAPFGYVQIVYMTTSSWLIFSQPPSVWIFVGAPIIIGSGLYIWLRERQLAKTVVTDVATRD